MVFAAYIRETVARHRQFKMVPELWSVMNVFSVVRNRFDGFRHSGRFLKAFFRQKCHLGRTKRRPGLNSVKTLQPLL